MQDPKTKFDNSGESFEEDVRELYDIPKEKPEETTEEQYGNPTKETSAELYGYGSGRRETAAEMYGCGSRRERTEDYY